MNNEKLLEKIRELEDELSDKEDKISDLEFERDNALAYCEETESELSDLEDELERTTINTQRDGGIRWKADNLLDQQIMEALSELLE